MPKNKRKGVFYQKGLYDFSLKTFDSGRVPTAPYVLVISLVGKNQSNERWGKKLKTPSPPLWCVCVRKRFSGKTLNAGV